jgi:hypothetical protein
MTIEAVGALLFRMLGVVLLLLGALTVVGMAVSYVSVPQVQVHDVYYVVGESTVLAALLLISGALFTFCSKPLGRVLTKGLQ